MQGELSISKSRFIDFVTLAKPELTLLSVATAVCGGYIAGPVHGMYLLLFHVFLGTLLVGSGAGALNQYRERQYDALMHRTANRPIPSGRVRPVEALVFGCSISILGVAELFWGTNAVAAGLSVATITTYLFLYTPLKRLTPAATLVGALPGALPPVIGWVAVRGTLGIEPLVLFAILFFWQIPHFLSLAWLYKADYVRAGYRILTAVDPGGARTSANILVYSGMMVTSSFLPVILGLDYPVFGAAAAILGILFLSTCLGFIRSRTASGARKLFLASLIYLPALFSFLIIFRV